jgi:hypothetical protein
MPKVTLEPQKTTWVKFIDEKATMKVERTCKVYYYKDSILENTTQSVEMKYLFSGLKGGKCIPSSQLIIKEKGIPVTITQTAISMDPTKFSSMTTSDAFVEISDDVASVEKSKVKEKKLSRRVIEREWEETVTRVIKIKNKTGKKVALDMSIFENPADGILFESSNPKPNKTTPPERKWEIRMPKEDEKIVSIKFKVKRIEQIRLPPDKSGGKEQALDEDFEDIMPEAAGNQPANFDQQNNAQG